MARPENRPPQNRSFCRLLIQIVEIFHGLELKNDGNSLKENDAFLNFEISAVSAARETRFVALDAHFDALRDAHNERA